MKIKPKELLKNTKIKIIICFVVLIVLVVIGIFAYNKISIMTKENEYADKIYNVISLKYKDKGKYMDKINKQIDNFKKSKVSSKDGINSKLLQIADKAVDENYLLGAGTVLDKQNNKEIDNTNAKALVNVNEEIKELYNIGLIDREDVIKYSHYYYTEQNRKEIRYITEKLVFGESQLCGFESEY
ncbi:MAG: hypothetical protein IIU14_01940 [Ruminococcus sp.]|nr:hypothetical protein [Ruminococcus sp.]